MDKKTLISIATRVKSGERIDARLLGPFLDHVFPETSSFGKLMLRVAAWISLFFASVLVIFPEVGEWLISVLPGFFLLPERLAKAMDYMWGLVGKPVKKQHLMYHLPNIIIYSFGVVGLRQIWRKVHRNNWKDLVETAQEKLRGMVEQGSARMTFSPGFSLLFIGDSDQVAKSLVLDDPLIGPSLASRRPPYTRLWAKFVTSDGDEGLRRALDQFNSEDAGEYVFFPVVDDNLFLPGPTEYDVAPHRVEIAVRRIRQFEDESGWAPKRIVIVGDAEQRSRFVTAAAEGPLEEGADDVTLGAIAETYPDVTVADPTEITLRRIVEIADGRRILFRASDDGATKYSARFYHRLSQLGYTPSRSETLTVGYDITDLETEHQIVSQDQSSYLPVILSREVFDLLSDTYLKSSDYIFVPRLVKKELQKLVA